MVTRNKRERDLERVKNELKEMEEDGEPERTQNGRQIMESGREKG